MSQLREKFDWVKGELDSWKLLEIVYGEDTEQQTAWLREQLNTDPFDGKSPLEFIRDSKDIDVVSKMARSMDGP